tara:strand:- start:1072 stop:2175 length:1104 start_codon:yes stop_codon:yes gene_type:complete
MSTKKDNQKKIDKVYMELALNLARENVGLTGPNPSVGCVIVKNNEIISFGQTSFNGRPHAEHNAILSANKSKLKDSTMYVSLEPCTHFGKTDPCTDLIIKSKIKKLFYAHDDIDYRTSKRAEIKLIKGQVKVIKNFLSHKAKKIYKSYFYNKKNNLPYVIGKIACSKDLFSTHQGKIITNEYSRSVTHLLRYKNQGILSTSKSSNSDNSRLDCRLNGLNNKSPKIFIIDKNLNINHKSNIVKNAKKIKTFIFYNKEKKIKKKLLLKSGIKLVKIRISNDTYLNIFDILMFIKKKGINYLLVEGGHTLTKNLLNKKIFNEFFLFKSNIKLLKRGKNNISSIIASLNKSFKHKSKINTFLDKDILINYK